jgi:hypothetical protein
LTELNLKRKNDPNKIYNVGAQSTRGHITTGDKSISLQIVMQAGLILLQAARTMTHQPITKLVYMHGTALLLVLPPWRRGAALHWH